MATGAVLSSITLGILANTVPRPAHALHTNTPKVTTTHATAPRPTTMAKPSPRPTPTPNVTLPHNYPNPSSDGFITNEFAFFNPVNPARKTSPNFDVTSGSLYGRGGDFWTGNPASCEPDASSGNCTNSNVFRLNTKQKYHGNITVSLMLMQLANVANPDCNSNDTCWYGAHLWLRYQSQYNLYYASVNRADGQVVIKRKVPCGPDNDGTYFVIGAYTPHAFSPNAWSRYRVSIQTDPDSGVTLKLYDTDTSAITPVVTGTDHGGTNPNWSPGCATAGHYTSAAYPPITADGSIGIRGDYSNFVFRDFSVSALTSP